MKKLVYMKNVDGGNFVHSAVVLCGNVRYLSGLMKTFIDFMNANVSDFNASQFLSEKNNSGLNFIERFKFQRKENLEEIEFERISKSLTNLKIKFFNLKF